MTDDPAPTAMATYRAAIRTLARQLAHLDEGVNAEHPPHVTDLDELRVAEQGLHDARRALVVLLRTGVDERTDRGRLEIVRPHSWSEIAAALGVTRQAAQKAYQTAVAEHAPGGRVVTRVQRQRIT